MTTKRRRKYLLKTVMLAIFLTTDGAELGRGQVAVSPSKEAKNAVGFNALAQKVREARRNARRGDIFSEQARKAFSRTVREEFGGPHGHGARTTIRQGEPLKTIHLHVNEPYPDGVPYTTLPPTLLLKFPKLPDQVAYRIVVRDLILLDVEANLVIDKIPDIFPETL